MRELKGIVWVTWKVQGIPLLKSAAVSVGLAFSVEASLNGEGCFPGKELFHPMSLDDFIGGISDQIANTEIEI